MSRRPTLLELATEQPISDLEELVDEYGLDLVCEKLGEIIFEKMGKPENLFFAISEFLQSGDHDPELLSDLKELYNVQDT